MFDPKGDADLLRRMYAEAHRAGRQDNFWVFHLGWPDISARYNAVGRFSRISEVASRVAGQLSGEGNSAAFREFAWRFVNIITRALVALGQRPDYGLILRYVTNIGELYETYVENMLSEKAPQLLSTVEALLGSGISEKDLPRHMQGRPNGMNIWAIEQVLASEEGKNCGTRCWMGYVALCNMIERISTKLLRHCCRCLKSLQLVKRPHCWHLTIRT